MDKVSEIVALMKAEEALIFTLIKSGIQFMGVLFYTFFSTHNFSIKCSCSHLSSKLISPSKPSLIFATVAHISLQEVSSKTKEQITDYTDIKQH